MTSIDLLTTGAADAWRALIPASRNVFGSVEFARIAEANGGTPARLFVWRSGDAVAVYPHFLRDRDTFTPEFTGPMAVDVPEQWSERELQEAFHRHAVESGIVAEFAHLDPFRPHASHSEFESFNREIVWIDLTRTPEQMWSEDFSHACRKNINRAKSENVTVRRAASRDDVREFHRIYFGTMDRNAAQAKYYFPLDYFLRFFDELPEQSIFLLGEHQGRVIAATLYLADDTNVFSYLGGADHEYQALRPTNLVIQRMIELGRERGCRRLILGGGYRPDDGIFRFKASFSPLRARFSVYRRVHLQEEYDRLVAEWSSQHGVAPPADFFPAYRAKPPVPEAG